MKDFNIEITKGHGPGGQNKNRRMTCVKVTHIPTGITETCQDQRTQGQNKKIAMQRVKARIQELNRQELIKKQGEDRARKIKNPTRVRTYNFTRNEVIDHLTGKRAALDEVLDGHLDLLI